MRSLKASGKDAGTRADIYLASKYPGFSRSSLEALFDSGKVTLEREALKPAYRLREGDKLAVDDRLLFADPPMLRLPVIYEDEDVIVIDKPAGVLTHAKGALNSEATVASFIKDRLKGFEEGSNRAGIVHRLDRGTSGVIITARTPEALAWLQKQFSQRKTVKIYEAVVDGIPRPDQAVIDAPIARNPRKPQTFAVSAAGKPSQTEYKSLKSFHAGGKDYSLLELRPRTGRTHQLRVHLAYIGHPVTGDRVYGRGDGGTLLHAKSLEITLPSRRRVVFKAPRPTSIKEFLSRAG